MGIVFSTQNRMRFEPESLEYRENYIRVLSSLLSAQLQSVHPECRSMKGVSLRDFMVSNPDFAVDFELLIRFAILLLEKGEVDASGGIDLEEIHEYAIDEEFLTFVIQYFHPLDIGEFYLLTAKAQDVPEPLNTFANPKDSALNVAKFNFVIGILALGIEEADFITDKEISICEAFGGRDSFSLHLRQVYEAASTILTSNVGKENAGSDEEYEKFLFEIEDLSLRHVADIKSSIDHAIKSKS